MATVKCWGLVVWLHITGAMCAGVLLAQTIEIPRVWLTVSPKEVLADIDFHRLPMRDRQRIMSEVDPDFRRLSDKKKNRLLREAERASLPKAGTPRVVKRWDPKDPDCSLELRGVLAVKTLKTSPVSVTASLEKKWGFLDASVALRNESPETLAVVPETFTATVVRPKRKILLFEFPRTVSDELLWVALNYTSPDRISTATLEAQTTTSSTKDPLSVVTQRSTGTVTYRDPLPPTERADTSIFKYAFDTAGQIRTEALRAGAIPPGGALDGHVWFTLNKILSMRGVGENVRADEVNLTIFIQNAAFEIPFVLNGR